MSEAVQLAKAAREQLAAALNALQSDNQVPGDMLEVAEPIATRNREPMFYDDL